MLQSSKFNRLVVAGIAAAAISPTAALARPATTVALPRPRRRTSGRPTRSPVARPARASCRTCARPTRSTARRSTPTPGRDADVAHQPAADREPRADERPVADDDGVDGGVLVAIGGGALLLVGGIGLAGRKRLQLVRQRQPA